MDNVDRVLAEIKGDSEIMRVRFSGFLDDVANILERHGFGITKAFLLERQERKGLRAQASALLKVLEKIEKYPDVSANREVGRLIIRAIEPIQKRR